MFKRFFCIRSPSYFWLAMLVTILLRVSYITTNLYCKSRNLPITDLRNYNIDLRLFLRHPVLLQCFVILSSCVLFCFPVLWTICRFFFIVNLMGFNVFFSFLIYKHCAYNLIYIQNVCFNYQLSVICLFDSLISSF